MESPVQIAPPQFSREVEILREAYWKLNGQVVNAHVEYMRTLRPELDLYLKEVFQQFDPKVVHVYLSYQDRENVVVEIYYAGHFRDQAQVLAEESPLYQALAPVFDEIEDIYGEESDSASFQPHGL